MSGKVRILFKSVLLIICILMVCTSCGGSKSKAAAGPRTLKIDGVSFAIFQLGNNPPSWAPADGMIYMEKSEYDLDAGFIKLLSEKFNKRVAMSQNEFDNFSNETDKIGEDKTRLNKIKDIYGSMTTSKDKAHFELANFGQQFGYFMIVYFDQINPEFMNETDANKITVSIAKSLKTDNNLNKFVLMNTLFPQSQFNLSPYTVSAD